MKESHDAGFIDLGDEVKIIVKYLIPGTKLMYKVYDEEGKLVLPPRTSFTQEKINELLTSGVETLYYSKIEPDSSIMETKNLHEYLNNNVYKGPRAITIETQKEAVSTMKKLVLAIDNNEDFNFDDTKRIAERILHDIDEADEEIINLLAIQIYDEYTYTHSLNVGIISMMMARKIGRDDKFVKEIGLSGFLHDIGKTKIPYELIHKKEPLTPKEFEIMKKHPVYGYELIKDSPQLSKSVKDVILLHHERYDGSGYPFGLKGDQISDEVGIVAIAESYDSLTSDHPYRKAHSKRDSFQKLLKETRTLFKTDVVHRFVNDVGNILLKENNFFTIGCYVLLNTNEIAKVVSKDSEMTSQPGVEIVVNQQGKILSKPIYVDLMRDGTRYIVRLVDTVF
ncbi:MAG: HD-GYP domain-containing protein [Spirochaetota bacterium]|nr:HD-GYP domain-containing protein [Spirochaetota bacterium]